VESEPDTGSAFTLALPLLGNGAKVILE
jgi:hypothetical protein